MEIETLNADTRPDAGTRSARKLRESGKIPAIIFSSNIFTELYRLV